MAVQTIYDVFEDFVTEDVFSQSTSEEFDRDAARLVARTFMGVVLSRPREDDLADQMTRMSIDGEENKKLRFAIPDDSRRTKAQRRKTHLAPLESTSFPYAEHGPFFPEGSLTIPWPRDLESPYGWHAALRSLNEALLQMVPQLDWHAPSDSLRLQDLDLAKELGLVAFRSHSLHGHFNRLGAHLRRLATQKMEVLYEALEVLATQLLKTTEKRFGEQEPDAEETERWEAAKTKLVALGQEADDAWDGCATPVLANGEVVCDGREGVLQTLFGLQKGVFLCRRRTAGFKEDLLRLRDRFARREEEKTPSSAFAKADAHPGKIGVFLALVEQVEARMKPFAEQLRADGVKLDKGSPIIGKSVWPWELEPILCRMCLDVFPLVKEVCERYGFVPDRDGPEPLSPALVFFMTDYCRRLEERKQEAGGPES